MRLIFFCLILLHIPSEASAAASDVCDILNLPNCRGVTRQLRRNTFQSAPTTATASNINPANVSFDKGLGVEVLAQPSNPLLFSLASGTGKMGGALISGGLDNSFFGNRTPELPEEFLERNETDKQYKNKKLTLALGAKFVARKNVGLDVGALFKRHSEVKKINPGAGVSARLWRLHFGASVFRDDMYLNLQDTMNEASGMRYAELLGKEEWTENFLVTTLTVGTRIDNFSLDVGSIKSKLDFYDEIQTHILIYSAAFQYKDALFNMALRQENSGAPVYKNERLEVKKEKSDMYFGFQYSLNRHLILGVSYNYFLLKEMSATLSLFL